MFITPHLYAPMMCCDVGGTWWEMQAENQNVMWCVWDRWWAGVRLRTGWQVWDVWLWGAAGSKVLNREETNVIMHTLRYTDAAGFTCTHTEHTQTHLCDGACMCPHLGHGAARLCSLKVNCPAVMGKGGQTGTNWHEWARQRALCGWRRGERLLSMCPCLWIMCSTFSKGTRTKMSDRQQH